MESKVREAEAGWMGAQHVPQVLQKALAARNILVVADTGWIPQLGDLLFLPPEAQGRNSENP